MKFLSHPTFLGVSFFTLLWALLALFLWPLRQMFFGTQGDELFIVAQLTQYMTGDLFSDFYYHHLPPFYPPLYFWLTGIISSFIASNAIGAMKIGLLVLALPLFFGGSYFVFSYFFKKDSLQTHLWWWLASITLYLIWIDLPEFITKPYEIIPAFITTPVIIWLVSDGYKEKQYLKTFVAGVIGGLSFLMYYFWWILFAPFVSIIFLIHTVRARSLRPLTHLVVFGGTTTIIALPYLLPLLTAWVRYGMENWQALHLVLDDFNLWLPFFEPSLHGIIALLGIIGFILYRAVPYLRVALGIFLLGYLYQALNYLSYLLGGGTGQPSKPFLFLGGACLTLSAAYVLVRISQRYTYARIPLAALMLGALMASYGVFWFNPQTQALYLKAQRPVRHAHLAQTLVATVPDYATRTWLSSGAPEIHVFIPLKYALAHNAHFSHQASLFSQRLKLVQQAVDASSPQEFNKALTLLDVDSLLLYYDSTTHTYPLFFWVDNRPHGGTTLRLDLNPALIDTSWVPVFANDEWRIFIRE